jgi:DNA-binding Lrp family transcriptional regulator
MTKKIDQKDLILLNELKKNAKCSSRSLAKRVNLPISTVHRRIKKLESLGIIKGYTIKIDEEKIGKPTTILALINLEEVIPARGHVAMERVKEEMRKLGEIEEILTVQGWNFDIIAKARLTSTKESVRFLEKLRNIEGIEEVSSIVVSEEE